MSLVVFPYLPTVPLWVSLVNKCLAFDLLERGKNTENNPSHLRLDSGLLGGWKFLDIFIKLKTVDFGHWFWGGVWQWCSFREEVGQVAGIWEQEGLQVGSPSQPPCAGSCQWAKPLCRAETSSP